MAATSGELLKGVLLLLLLLLFSEVSRSFPALVNSRHATEVKWLQVPLQTVKQVACSARSDLPLSLSLSLSHLYSHGCVWLAVQAVTQNQKVSPRVQTVLGPHVGYSLATDPPNNWPEISSCTRRRVQWLFIFFTQLCCPLLGEKGSHLINSSFKHFI